MTETYRTLNDLQILIVRALRLSLRNVDGLVTALMLPPMLMFMFVYFFGGAIHTGVPYIEFVVPGVLLVCVGFGAGTTAVSVAHDLSGAIVDRLRSMDVRGESLIAGHVVASVARNLISAALAVTIAFAIGYRSHADAAHWLAAVALLTPVRARDLVVRSGDRDPRAIARGRAGHHVRDQLPAVSLQRVRPRLDHAIVAPSVRGQPAGQPGRGRGPGPAGGRLARRRGLAFDRLEPGDPGRVRGARRDAVRPARGLTAGRQRC
jgi:hypothetical protein